MDSIRILIAVGPGEEDEAVEAYDDLFDDSIEGWYKLADDNKEKTE